jgi:cyd operon protein YbgT
MWYFSWVLGLGLALCFSILNAMYLESNYAFGRRTEEGSNSVLKTLKTI